MPKTFEEFVTARRIKAGLQECIGGGYFVFRRGKKTGRVGVRSSLPFEHGSYESATREADRLAAENKGERYEVFHSTGMSAYYDPPPVEQNNDQRQAAARG